MDLIGIIAEFNPFHTGHAALLQQIRRHYGPTVPVVIILSGSFVPVSYTHLTLPTILLV